MNRIEFIGNAIFIPYFLIGVGMLINLGSLFEGPRMLAVVALIAFFGTFGKAVAAYLSSLLFRLPKSAGHMMFGLTCAHAAGAIAMSSSVLWQYLFSVRGQGLQPEAEL